MLEGAEMLSLRKQVGGGGERGVQWGQLRRSTQVTKTCQIPGKSSTESLHHAWNNAWEGEPSAAPV